MGIEDLETSVNVWMQRSPNPESFLAVLVSSEKFQIPGDRLAFGIVHLSRSLVTDPCVDTSSSGIDPENMIEAEVFS